MFVISSPADTSNVSMNDHISTYLDEGLVPLSQIQGAGGYLKWWNAALEHRPQVSKMALDYCSAPGMLSYCMHLQTTDIPLASSVDAERAFSVGRRQVSHLQHNMNSQTFKARMCVGSWANSAACPSLPDLPKILEETNTTTKGKKKASANVRDSGEDFTAELDTISVVDSDED